MADVERPTQEEMWADQMDDETSAASSQAVGKRHDSAGGGMKSPGGRSWDLATSEITDSNGNDSPVSGEARYNENEKPSQVNSILKKASTAEPRTWAERRASLNKQFNL